MRSRGPRPLPHAHMCTGTYRFAHSHPLHRHKCLRTAAHKVCSRPTGPARCRRQRADGRGRCTQHTGARRVGAAGGFISSCIFPAPHRWLCWKTGRPGRRLWALWAQEAPSPLLISRTSGWARQTVSRAVCGRSAGGPERRKPAARSVEREQRLPETRGCEEEPTSLQPESCSAGCGGERPHAACGGSLRIDLVSKAAPRVRSWPLGSRCLV